MMKSVFKKCGFAFLLTAVVAAITLQSCKNGTTGEDHKTDPSTIATENLVAYFPLDSANQEVLYSSGSITFNKVNGDGSFVPGRRGNAYKGSSSRAYLDFNVASDNPFKSMSEFTIAAWIKSPGNTEGKSANIFNLNGGDIFMHNIDLLQESGLGDSLKIKFYLYNYGSPNWKGQDTLRQASPFLDDQWFYLVVLYDKNKSAIEFYADGKLVLTAVRHSGPKTKSGDQPMLGPLEFKPDMSRIYIGAWPQQALGSPDPWMRYYNGMIDELRIYNRALSPSEIESLYQAELSQVNP